MIVKWSLNIKSMTPKKHLCIKTVITGGAGTKEQRDNFGQGSFVSWERRQGFPAFPTESGSAGAAWSLVCEREVGGQAIPPQNREAVGEEPKRWRWRGQELRSQAAGGAGGEDEGREGAVLLGAGSCSLSRLRRAAKCFLPGSLSLFPWPPSIAFHRGAWGKGLAGPGASVTSLLRSMEPPVCHRWRGQGRGDREPHFPGVEASCCGSESGMH